MENIDLKREFIAKLKKEGDAIDEFSLSRNPNYLEWLENKIIYEKETLQGLYVTDKKPEDLFRNIFVELIDKIGMDGEKTFSSVDFEYYEYYFNKGIKLLMWQIT